MNQFSCMKYTFCRGYCRDANLTSISFVILSRLLERAGVTSFTVRSTSTPPIMRKHLRSGSTSFSVSITNLKI